MPTRCTACSVAAFSTSGRHAFPETKCLKVLTHKNQQTACAEMGSAWAEAHLWGCGHMHGAAPRCLLGPPPHLPACHPGPARASLACSSDTQPPPPQHPARCCGGWPCGTVAESTRCTFTQCAWGVQPGHASRQQRKSRHAVRPASGAAGDRLAAAEGGFHAAAPAAPSCAASKGGVRRSPGRAGDEDFGSLHPTRLEFGKQPARARRKERRISNLKPDRAQEGGQHASRGAVSSGQRKTLCAGGGTAREK
jgi:hypothetical protein